MVTWFTRVTWATCMNRSRVTLVIRVTSVTEVFWVTWVTTVTRMS